jgi:hypothetical protein
VSLGQLIANLPQAKVDEMIQIARSLSAGDQKHTPKEAGEMAAVQAAVAAHQHNHLPENMFAPFTFVTPSPKEGGSGKLPVIHYGNVDTGSMVNVMYSGVL